MTTLYIDADACPVTSEALAVARRAGVPVVIAGGERMDSTRDVLQMVHDAIKAGGAGNAIAYHRNSTGLRLLNGILVVFDLGTNNAGNLFRFQLHCLVHHTIYKMKVESGGRCKSNHHTADFIAQTFQPALHSAVQAGSAKIQPQTAQNTGVHFFRQGNGFAGYTLQFFLQSAAGTFVQCNSRYCRNFQNVMVLVVSVTVSSCAGRQFWQNACFAQNL